MYLNIDFYNANILHTNNIGSVINLNKEIHSNFALLNCLEKRGKTHNMSCLFCDVPEPEILISNHLCFVRWDKFPVSPGHLLIIP